MWRVTLIIVPDDDDDGTLGEDGVEDVHVREMAWDLSAEDGKCAKLPTLAMLIVKVQHGLYALREINLG